MLLEELNDSQRAAVEYCDGASLVIAGAGSGKTRVLTYKIAYLLEQGMKPWNILALTFTNKAAREMKERIAKLVGEESARYLNMGTFHSIFSHILRRESQHIGFTPQFTIYDDADQKSLVKQIIKEMQLDDKVYKPGTVANNISMAKNHLILPDSYAQHTGLMERDRAAKMTAMPKIYSMYMQRCRNANAMDFDDLLIYTYKLMHDNPEVLAQYVERYEYVLVDEYQDTNLVQQEIVKLLTMSRQRVCVVGDDAQSIYSFRGANIDNILNFQDIYDNTKLFKLEQNYRSTQSIVQAANSLIQKNARQIRKDVYSHNDKGEPLAYVNAASDREEASIVVNNIKRLCREQKMSYEDFVILYRTNAQSRTFEDELRKQNIPYRIYGGLSFYQRKEIKDVLAYFRLVVNHDDEEAFRRIVNYPKRGLGDTSIQKVLQSSTLYQVSPWQVTVQPAVFNSGLSATVQSKLGKFVDLINGFASELDMLDAYELGRKIIQESGISRELYSAHETEDIARQENLEEFMAALQDFVDSGREQDEPVGLTDFLQTVALQTDMDKDDDEDDENAGKRVSLMTIHSAKGLEYPVVFVVGVEENIFPSPMCTQSPRQLEEERRLFYVAITRAEKYCFITSAKNRYRYGRMEFDTPSRFIRDISPEYMRWRNDEGLYGAGGSYGSDYERQSRTPWQNAHPVASQFKADPVRKVTAAGMRPLRSIQRTSSPIASAASSSSSIGSVTAGCTIEHQRFGIGKVLSVEGTGENAKATVEFRNSGTKQLLLKFAKFKVL